MADKPVESTAPDPGRRDFLTAAAAVAAGGVVVATPLCVGMATLLDPLAKSAAPQKVRIALLDQTPDDGVPRFFPVIADRVDAWNRYPSQRVGAVYLVREKGAKEPTAFTAKCPHAGCFIGYAAGSKEFRCPCHTSAFNLDGTRVHGDKEVAPRNMDKLPVEIRTTKAADGAEVAEVWVEFMDFETGKAEQIRSA